MSLRTNCNTGVRSKIISEVTVRQWVLFLQPRYDVIFTTRFFFYLFFFLQTASIKERKEKKDAHNSSPSETALAYWLDAADVRRFFLVVIKITWPSVREKLWIKCFFCCVNKTHCFSLPAEATHEYNCRFCIVKGKFSCFFFTTWVLFLEFRLPPFMIILYSLSKL